MVSRPIASAPASDSAAASVAISAPQSENMVVVTPANIAVMPAGAKPPWAVRLPNVGPAGEVMPKANAPVRTIKTRMDATFIDANQNSNSPKDRVDNRFTPVNTAISTTPTCQISNWGNQPQMILAPAIASMAITTTQKYQYSQPTTKPAQLPTPALAKSGNV